MAQNINRKQTPPISRQNNTTNTTVDGARIETGWGFIPGTGTYYGTKAVTFQTPFTTVPIILITPAGGNASSGTGSYPDAGNLWDNEVGAITGPSTTGFTAVITRPNGATWPSGMAMTFTWMAIGN